MTLSTDATSRSHASAHGNHPGAIGYLETVKIKFLTGITLQYAVAAALVKINDDPTHLQELDAPARKRSTISSAVSTASRPLFDESGIERSSACCTVSVVRTPKITGTRVLSCTS